MTISKENRLKMIVRSIVGLTQIQTIDCLRSKRQKKSRHYSNFFKHKSIELRGNIKECQKCGSNLFLCVHHLDHDKHNNSDSNLIVLCFECHKKEHPHLRMPAQLLNQL